MEYADPRFIDADGVRLALYEGGPDDGPLVLCVHGWPETAYSWTPIAPALEASGFRVAAFDLPGFGRSDCPDDVGRYAADALADQIAAVTRALGRDRVVLFGHDWGGAVVWRAAQRHPDRVAGMIALCTAHHARPPADPIAIWRKRVGPDHYIVRFQEAGPPEKILEADVEKTLRFIFQKPAKAETIRKRFADLLNVLDNLQASGPVPDDRIVMSLADLSVYVSAFERTGFGPGLNLYRNITRNWDDQAAYSDKLDQPALMISADRDVMLPPSAADGLEALVPRVEKHVLEGVGHWVQHEAPKAASAIVVDWLARTRPWAA